MTRLRLRFLSILLAPEVAVSILVFPLITGCVVAPIPVPTHSRLPNGAQASKKELDLTFIQQGKTSREEVLSNLSIIDTGYGDTRPFWGRWTSSSWALGYMAGGPYVAKGGASRLWRQNNLVIVFDEHGTVESSKLFDQAKEAKFVDELREILQSASFQPDALPEVLPAQTFIDKPLRVTLFEDRISVEQAIGNPKAKTIPLQSLASFSVPLVLQSPQDKDPGFICATLHGAAGTHPDKLNFCMDGPQLAKVLEYLVQRAPKDFRW